MLAEYLTSRLSLCLSGARALGYADEVAAILARAGRRRRDWATHLRHSHAATLTAADQCTRTRTALILGSGALLDIPVAELRRRFRRIILADIVHPPQARWQARRHVGVQLALVDLTGLALAADPLATPPGCEAFLDEPDIDLVVSANLASQLPLRPLARLAEPVRPWQRQRLGAAIVAAHLAHLTRFACPVCLIADTARWQNQAADTDPLFGVSLPGVVLNQWEWRIDGPALRTRVTAVLIEPATGN